MEEGSGLALERLVQATLGEAVPRAAVGLLGLAQVRGDDVEEQRVDTSVGEMGGDAGAHDACADHADASDWLGHAEPRFLGPLPVGHGLVALGFLAFGLFALGFLLARLLDGAREVRSVEELHHEVGGAVGQRAEVRDVDDVLVTDGGRALGLLAEARDDLLVLRHVRTEDLHRERLAQHDVLAEVDETHAAFTEHALDEVAAVDGGPDEWVVVALGLAFDHAQVRLVARFLGHVGFLVGAVRSYGRRGGRENTQSDFN